MQFPTISYLVILCSLNISIWSSVVSAHGGIPRVLTIYPPHNEQSPLWVIDTLGVFRGDALNQDKNRIWSWLCDDAVDPTLGVDDLLIINEQIMLAIAKSGLYRSNDGGCTFLRINSEVSEQALGIISAHPTLSNEMLVYTDSIGRENSVWWSQNQGQTWQRSDLSVEGMIYKLWRNPEDPNQIWVNHSAGLSLSDDGGRTFNDIDPQGYGLDISPYEARLLGGGRLGEAMALFIAVNRYPTASLLLSVDQGQTWRVIHQANDSYESLLLTSEALWLSTPFEGLFIHPLSDLERLDSDLAWQNNWRQRSDQFISCLIEDPLQADRVWGCGRASPSDWIVGYSDTLGADWTITMERYSNAAGRSWTCPPNSTSVLACQARCLEDGCDPSGLEMNMMSMPNLNTSNMSNEESSATYQAHSNNCTTHSLNPFYCLSFLGVFFIYVGRRFNQING